MHQKRVQIYCETKGKIGERKMRRVVISQRYDLFTIVKLAGMFGCGFVHQVTLSAFKVTHYLWIISFLFIQKVNIWLWPHTLFFHCLFVYRFRTRSLGIHNGSRIKMTDKSKLPRYLPSSFHLDKGSSHSLSEKHTIFILLICIMGVCSH